MDSYLAYLKKNPKNKITSYYPTRIKRPKKERYVDFKKPAFEFVEVGDFDSGLKLESFSCVPEHLGFGYVIVLDIDGYYQTIEGQEVHFGDTIKRQDSGFVDLEKSTGYFKNDEREIRMNGSYFHGFHYFRRKSDALQLTSTIFKMYNPMIVEASIYTSNARGIMLGLETHVTTQIYLHET